MSSQKGFAEFFGGPARSGTSYGFESDFFDSERRTGRILDRKRFKSRRKNRSSGVYFPPIRIPSPAPPTHVRSIPTILREGGSRRVIGLSWLRSRKSIARAPA